MTKFLNNADIKGYIAQTAVTSYLIKADSTGRLVAAIAGTDYVAPSALSAYVPYTGATGNVTLGEYGVTAGYLGFDLTPTSTPTGIGTMYWDAANRTVSLIDGDGDTTLQIGQEERVLIHNGTGATLTDGQVVYVTGSTGELPSVALADASIESTSAATLGMVTETIANGADGFVTLSGIVHGLNTLAFNEGDLLWLSETAGEYTNVKPISPAHLVLIGYVIKKAGGNGSIFVKIQNTQELAESSDVLFTSLTNNDGLFYDSATSLWKNKTIAAVLGYTPANGANYLALTGGTLTGDLTLSGTNPRLYFTDTDNNPDYFISNTDGTFTVYDVTNSVGRFKIYTTGNAEFTNNLTVARLLTSTNTSNSTIVAGGMELQSYAVNNSWIGENVYFDGVGFKYRANGYASQIYFKTDGSIGFRVGASGTAGGSYSPIEAINIANSGNVLIGTTTDGGYKFDVSGSARVSSTFQVGGNLYGVGATFSSSIAAAGFSFTTGARTFKSYTYGTDLTVNTAGGWAQAHRIYNEAAPTQTWFFGAIGTTAYIRFGNPAVIDVTGYNGVGFGLSSSGAATFDSSLSATNITLGSGTIGSIPSWMKVITTDATQSGIGAVYNNKAVYLYNNGSAIKLDAYDYATSTGLNIQIGGNGGKIIASNGQVQFTAYTSATSYSGTAAGYLAFDSSGNVITVASVAATDSTKLPLTGGALTGPLTITGNGSYLGDWGYKTLELNDTSGYAGIFFKNGANVWITRRNGADNAMDWAYSTDATSQGVGTFTHKMRLASDEWWVSTYPNYKMKITGGDVIDVLNGSSATTLYLNYQANTGANVNIAASKFVFDNANNRLNFSKTSGTLISHGSMTDAIGYNASYGTYIGSPVGGATYYIYANGSFYDNGTVRTLLHSGNYSSYALPLSGGTMSGILYSTYNTATGRANLGFNTAKTVLGNYHIQNGGGPGNDNSNQAAITFQGGTATEAQAGIYVLNNGSYGTSMGFAVTESYATGPQLFMTATNGGVVNFPRATPTVQGNAVIHAGNIGSQSVSYATSAGSVAYANITASSVAGWMTNARNGTGARFYLGHSDGYGMHINTYTATASIYALELHNNAKQLFAVMANGAVYADGGNQVLHAANYSSYALPLSGGVMTGSLVNNTDGAVLMESNAPENNNWLWKENAKSWGLFWFNRGTQSGQTIGGYTTVGAELMFMGGSSGIAMPTGWTGYQSGSYIAAMISNYSGYIWSASTIYAAGDMRAPIFYDSNDTGYYLDPNGYSNLGRLRTNSSINDSGTGAIYGRNHAYDTVEIRGYGSELMIGSQGTDIHINYRTCNSGISGHTPVNWYWRAGASNNYSNHYFGEVYANGWFRTTGNQGLYNPTNGAHFYPNDLSYGSWRILGSRNGWTGLHFGGGNGITLMMNEGEFGFHREAVGWVARFTSGTGHFNISGNAASANSATSASYARYFETNYVGGQQTNPQVYFNYSQGLNVAMTGAWSVWSDTLWINGYAGGDVPWMCALHFLRNSEPRMAISAQTRDSSGYGTYYEILSTYNASYAKNMNQNVRTSDDVSFQFITGARRVMGEYLYSNGWVYSSGGNTGWLQDNQNQGIRAAGYNSYFGTIATYGNNSNGYGGYTIMNNYRVILMQNSSGDFGFYNNDDWKWNLFYNRGNDCWGIGTDNTYSGDGFRCIKYGSAQYGWTTWSDRRAKENISTITGALDKVLNMRGVYFNYIIDEEKTKRVGFIAQELQEILPEAVRYAEEIDEYNVEYGQIVSVLTEAIKEQNIKIQSLEAQLQTLLN